VKPEVRLLIPVWGRRYIRLFADLTLASVLAPGNMPALAELGNVEVFMLTASTDYGFFEEEPAFRALRRIVPVRFVPIDDLIVGNLYGVTLTLAYLRGVAELGERMVDTHFVFLNADLILAEGSLRSVGRRILRGDRVLLACSIRGTSEEIEPDLRALVDERDYTLTVPSRTLVGMAMQAMHPTQIAKIVNNDLCHSAYVNQFYWQVDANTLLSKHFLMFMLCLRPERVVTEVHSFCDYSFVPEMCPDAPMAAFEDSDEFFFLEMQERASERDFLRLGSLTIEETATSLSRWTTQRHRDYSKAFTLVFHAAGAPAAAADTGREADEYIRLVHEHLEPEPKPYRHHPYWIGAYESWRIQRDQLRGNLRPPITSQAGPSTRPSRLFHLARAAYRAVFGRVPLVTMMHPDWEDYRSVRALIRSAAEVPESNVLYVTQSISTLGEALHTAVKHVVSKGVSEVLGSPLRDSQRVPETYALILVELTKQGLPEVRALIERLAPRLQAGRELAVFVKVPAGEAADLGERLLDNLGLVAPQALHRTSVVFAGGPERRRVRELFAYCQAAYAKRDLKSLLTIPPLLAVAMVRSLAVNLRLARGKEQTRLASDCTALTILFRN